MKKFWSKNFMQLSAEKSKWYSYHNEAHQIGLGNLERNRTWVLRRYIVQMMNTDIHLLMRHIVLWKKK